MAWAKDPGFLEIDYSRFLPRGFYTRNEPLRRHFRLASWLQAIPFRVEKDEELLAALILARAAIVPDGPRFETARRGRAALDSFREFLGAADDWSLGVLSTSQTQFARIKEELAEKAEAERPRINDQVSLIPKDSEVIAAPRAVLRLA